MIRRLWICHVGAWGLGLAIVLSGFGCKSSETPSTWVSVPPATNGEIGEWTDLPTTYYEEEEAVLGFANDSSFLYLHFRTRDPKWAETIRVAGLTVYLDPDGGKSKDFYVKFRGGPPIGNPDEMRQRLGEAGNDRNVPADQMNIMAARMADSAMHLTCFVKDVIVEKNIPKNGSEGPMVAFDTSMGFYCYEFRVPLTESLVRYYGLNARPGDRIGIGALWGDMEDFLKSTRDDDGGRGGGMGGGRGGGKGGGRGGGTGGGRGGRSDMPEKQEVWLTTRLAEGPVSR